MSTFTLLASHSSDQYVNPLMRCNVRRRYCCHELFGFDVMLDENLKPWIIEVNISPRYVPAPARPRPLACPPA